MNRELKIINISALSEQERTELDAHIQTLISTHKNNRQEINRLVFESVSAMTVGEDYEQELASKKGLRCFLGNFTGSNKKLQDKINSSRAAAQYAGQQTLQHLAEQNLMSFELITAVYNKLNACELAMASEIKHIYDALLAFLKQSRSDVLRLEYQIEQLERNVNLLTWKNSIEYQMLDGVEYAELDDISKIVCMVRDFYNITEGKWTTSDLLLLKAAMKEVGMLPQKLIKYFDFMQSLVKHRELRDHLLGFHDIIGLPSPEYLPLLSGIKKGELLQSDEKYTVHATCNLLTSYQIDAAPDAVANELMKTYISEESGISTDATISCYDLMLELLYSLLQARQEGLLHAGEQDDYAGDTPEEEPEEFAAPETLDNYADEASQCVKCRGADVGIDVRATSVWVSVYHDGKFIDRRLNIKFPLTFEELETFDFQSAINEIKACISPYKKDERSIKATLASSVYQDLLYLQKLQDKFESCGLRLLCTLSRPSAIGMYIAPKHDKESNHHFYCGYFDNHDFEIAFCDAGDGIIEICDTFQFLHEDDITKLVGYFTDKNHELQGNCIYMACAQYSDERVLSEIEGLGIKIERIPPYCASRGAVMQSAIRMGDCKEMMLLDVVPTALDVTVNDEYRQRMIEKDTTIPTKKSTIIKPSELSCLHKDGKPIRIGRQAVVKVWQIDSENQLYKHCIAECKPYIMAEKFDCDWEIAVDIDAHQRVSVTCIPAEDEQKREHFDIPLSSFLKFKRN